MWTSLFYSEHQLFLRPSRRLANWNYFNWMVRKKSRFTVSVILTFSSTVLFQVAYNISLLVLFLLTDLLAVYFSQTYPRATAGSSQSRQSRSKGAYVYWNIQRFEYRLRSFHVTVRSKRS